jgi:fatty-acyl-CoA synthase
MRAIDYFDKAAELYPRRIAIVDRGKLYSYADVQVMTRRIAGAMKSAGVSREQGAGLYSINDARVLVCMLGVLRAGASWVPINYRNGIDANVEFMNYVKLPWLFYHSSFTAEVTQMKSRVPSLRHLVGIDRPDGDTPSLDSFIESGNEATKNDWGDPLGNVEELMGIVATGGTTGPAKGVRVTNLAWGSMLEMASHYWRCDDVEPVCLTVAPLSHAAAPVAFAMLTLGAKNVVLPAFDAPAVVEAIERERVTHLFLPPTALYKLLALPGVERHDYSSLRVFLIVGSPVSPDKLKLAVEVFGPCMCQCYGQTEVPMLMTWLDQKTAAAASRGLHPERLRSCGKATSAVRLAIMDEAGNQLPPNQTGEIVARGSLVTPGYYNMPEATAEVRTFGWHHTGDVGYRDEEGYFYIVDRKKDMIITGGFNVFSAEVEAGVMALPEVQECAVIGVPDDTWGEAVKAMIVLRSDATLTTEAVMAHCKAKLGPVKSPKSVEFCAEIPKTPAGKVDRKTLRAPYWKGTDRAVH